MTKEKDELSKLKEQHGTVYTLTVPVDEGEEVTVYLKKLDRPTYSAVSKIIQKDELQATEVLLKNLYVGGAPLDKITGDFDALRSASNSVVPILEAKEGSLKKN